MLGLSKIELYGIAAALAFTVFGGWLLVHDAKVASRTVSKIERKDAANVSKANSAAVRSRSGSGGMLDPHVRGDD